MTNLSSSSIKTNLGESVTMLCAATGEQPITFAWFKDLKPISSFVEVQNPFPSSILVIKLEDKGSFGNYICQIRDRSSETSHAVVVADSSTGWLLFDSFFISFVYSSIYSFIHSLVYLFIRSFVYSLILLFVHFVYLFINLFIYFFIYLFIHIFI